MFKKGQSGNPAGKPKSLYKNEFDDLIRKKKMHEQGLAILGESWDSIVRSMVNHAVRGNVQAAVFLRDTFIGKPKETISHDLADKGIKVTLAYSDEKVNDDASSSGV
jgi:translation elongation factor EF-Ts